MRWESLNKRSPAASGRHALYNRRTTVWKCLDCRTDHVKAQELKDGEPRDRTVAATINRRGDVTIINTRGSVVVPERPEQCERCKSANIHKFDSLAESRHANELLMLNDRGMIGELEFHPRYVVDYLSATLEGNHGQITYTPDGRYRDMEGRLVIYDVKPKNSPGLDKDFTLRRKIIETAYGIEIKIVRR